MKKFSFAVGMFIALMGLTSTSMAQDQSVQNVVAGNDAYAAKNYDQAITDYQAALQGYPHCWQAYQGLGNCYYVKGDNATALTDFQKALTLNPSNASLASFVQNLQTKVNNPAPVVAAPAASSAAPTSATSSAPAASLTSAPAAPVPTEIPTSVPVATTSSPAVASAPSPVVTTIATPPTEIPTATPVATVAVAPSATVLPSSSKSENGKVVIQVQGGVIIPTSSGLAENTTIGPSIEGMIGYAFSKDFTLGVECGVDEWITPSTNAAWGGVGGLNHVPLELIAQLNMNSEGSVSPYILLGAGVAFDYSLDNPFSNDESWINFELDPGIGVAFNVAKDFNLFVQGKLAMDFASTTGLTGELIHAPNSTTSDSPIISIPVQLGINLSL